MKSHGSDRSFREILHRFEIVLDWFQEQERAVRTTE